VGLEASPQRISKNQPDLGTLCTRSVSTNILQLEARPSSSCNRCLPPGLVRQDLLCKPPMGINVESSVRDQSPTSSVEGLTMVSNPTVTIVQLSSPHPSSSRPLTSTRVNASSIPSSGSTTGPPQGVMPNRKAFRTSFRTQLASWRQKSNKSYWNAGVLNGAEIPFLVLKLTSLIS